MPTSHALADITLRAEFLRSAREATEYYFRVIARGESLDRLPEKTRAAVSAGDLAALQTIGAPFARLVSEATVLGSIAPLTTPATAGWPVLALDASEIRAVVVDEGKSIPVSRASVVGVLVLGRKIQALVVFDERSLNAPGPAT